MDILLRKKNLETKAKKSHLFVCLHGMTSDSNSFVKCTTLLIHATLPEEDASRDEGLLKIKKGISNIEVTGLLNTKHNVHWDKPKGIADSILKWTANYFHHPYQSSG
jgi:hypothetical protein